MCGKSARHSEATHCGGKPYLEQDQAAYTVFVPATMRVYRSEKWLP